MATTIVTALLIPFLKRIKSTQAIYELAPERHKEKTGTPTMGGIAILCGITAGCVSAIFTMGVSANLLLTLALTLVAGGIGMIDDLKKVVRNRNLGLRARHKLALQFLLALAFAFYYLYVADMGTYIILPFVWKAVNIGPWMLPYIVFIIVAMINAVNLTDGLDGLAAGTSFILTAFFPVFVMTGFYLSLARSEFIVSEYVSMNMADAMIFPALAGACIGFLIFNRHPAKIFMGDTGSLAIGAGIAAGAIFTHMELLLPIAGLVFVLEALSDVIQVGSYKFRKGKRVFKMAPLHHHFELSGWHEKKVVAVFITVTLLLCAACTVIMVLQGAAAGL